ncbi:MAG: alpha/beta hydrolase [Dehalococcoidales bacterium]|jgi:pimeloyl-ACP methyl ester carboxylesterase
MLSYTEGYLTIEGVKIHYYRTGGARPPFLLLHGAADNGLCWTPTAEWLSDRYDVIMPDAQGHGLSDRLDADFSYQKLTDQAVGLIKALGLKKPLIMGHSMGAGTVLNIAAGHPSIPGAVIWEDPAWYAPDTPPVSKEELAERDAFWKHLADLGKRPEAEIVASCRAQNPGWSEADIVSWSRAKLQFDPSLRDYELINPRTYVELVPQIKCPALLIIADGGIVTKSVAEHAARLGKNLKWVEIKGADHFVRKERFAAFRQALAAFLDTLPA